MKSSSTDTASAGLRVMLLNEDPTHAARLRDSLCAQGCESVCIAPNDSLLLRVERERPDALFLMLEHPDQSLLDSLEVIERHHPLPIVLQTRRSDSAYIRRALEAGVSHYLVGPIEPATARAALDVALARFETTHAMRHRLEHACNELETHKCITRAKVLLMQRRRLDEPTAHRLLLQTAMERNLKLGEAAALVIRLLDATDEGRSA